LDKKLPLFGKNTPLFNIFLKFRYFFAIISLFCKLTFNFKKQVFTHFNRLFSPNICKLNSAIFPLLLGKMIAVPLSRLRRFKKKNSARFEENSGVHRYLATLR
jgi:hypothetical protein